MELSPHMAICKLNNMQIQLSGGKRLLGLDVGKKTIGLAISDAGLTVASPLKILWRHKFTPDVEEIFALADANDVGGLIIGWPINMDGSLGPRCDSMRDLAHAMLRIRDIPIAFQDERLSTKVVEAAMLAGDMTRAKRAERRDALAAAWILQSALDRLHDNILEDTPPEDTPRPEDKI
jgi:putative Holliday junction resolvase